MWTAQEFTNVLSRHPDGGTLWARNHRTVRYIRVLRPDEYTTIALMTEIAGGKKVISRVELFCKTPHGIETAEFPDPAQTQEFKDTLINAPILDAVDPALRPAVNTFLSTPVNTVLTTW